MCLCVYVSARTRAWHMHQHFFAEVCVHACMMTHAPAVLEEVAEWHGGPAESVDEQRLKLHVCVWHTAAMGARQHFRNSQSERGEWRVAQSVRSL